MTTEHANIIISEADAYVALREIPQISKETAKSMAQAIALKPELATKADIAELSSILRVEIEKSRTETAQMESRLLRWFVSITVFGWGVMLAAMSLIVK